MKGFDFPLFNTKIPGVNERFQLEDPVQRRKYFEAKAGTEIEKIREYLRTSTFVAFLLGPKNSGKGTYAKLFMEAVGNEHISHVSVGDVVRNAHAELEDNHKKSALVGFLKQRYRGFVSVEQAVDIILGRDTKTLLPTEVVLALVQRQIDQLEHKALFIDGLPRNLDQVSYSLFFRALIGYRDDPDFFVFIDVPEAVIDERMKFRVICPACQTPRSPRLLRTKEIGYDPAKKEFYLICDNPQCLQFGQARMVAKEGDQLGIEAIRERINLDRDIMDTLLKLQGVPKVLLRNAVPVERAKEVVDDYEITPGYRYEWDENSKQVRVIEEPWVVQDDLRLPSYSLLPAAVALSFIKQTATALGL